MMFWIAAAAIVAIVLWLFFAKDRRKEFEEAARKQEHSRMIGDKWPQMRPKN